MFPFGKLIRHSVSLSVLVNDSHKVLYLHKKINKIDIKIIIIVSDVVTVTILYYYYYVIRLSVKM